MSAQIAIFSAKFHNVSKQQKPKAAIQTPEPAVPFFSNPKILGWILAIVSFAMYAGTIGHGFVLDDIAVVEQNSYVHEGFGGIGDIFTSFYWEGYWAANAGLYRPLSLVMFAMEWAVSPENPGIHHFVNVAVYVLCILLLFRLCRRLFSDFPPFIPFLIALLFAIHPIHTEVVANIKSRDELLCFLFFILLFLQLARDTITTKNWLLAALFFLLALLSKEAAALFLPVILLYFFLIRKFSLSRLIKPAFVLGLTAVCWFALHQYVIRTSPAKPIVYTYHDNSLVACGKSEQVATGIQLFGKYVAKSVWPSGMTYDYSFNDIPCVTFGAPVVWAVIILFIGVFLFCWKWRKKQPWLLFGLAFFTITMLLTTNILFLIGATFGERLLFTPVWGIIILLVIGGYALTQSYTAPAMKNALLGLTVLLAVGGFGLTLSRNADWKSNETLFTAGFQTGSNSARVHANYGTMLMQQAQQLKEGNKELYKEAIVELRRAVAIDSNDFSALTNLGVSWYHLDKYAESVDATLKANRLQPADTSLYFNLGDAYFALKDYSDAQLWYEKGIRSTDKTKLGDYERLGSIFFDRKQYQQAIGVFTLGLKRFPDQENLLMNTASCYGAMSDFQKAAEMFYKVYQLDPSNKNALEMMRMSEARGGIKVAK